MMTEDVRIREPYRFSGDDQPGGFFKKKTPVNGYVRTCAYLVELNRLSTQRDQLLLSVFHSICSGNISDCHLGNMFMTFTFLLML